ncbi:unnamed protein product, partial [Rotaria sordida]
MSASGTVQTNWTGTWYGATEAYPKGTLGNGWNVTFEIGPYPMVDNNCTMWRSIFKENGTIKLTKDNRFCREHGPDDLYIYDGSSGVKVAVQWIHNMLVSSFKYNDVFAVATMRMRGDILEEEILITGDNPAIKDVMVVHLLDLPNEMLFNILKKLENVDILYSFFGINNERLEKIIEDEFFSNSLNIASITENSTTIDAIFDRFCDYILPRIYFNVKCFIVEPEFMERILLANPYPNLTELKLFNFQRDSSLHYFTDNSSLEHILKEQITKLDLIHKDDALSIRYLPSNTFPSSTLTYLCINVQTFTDFVCLLDGRLKQLSTLIIQLYQMDTDSSVVHNL